ncbi:hypothetical protein AB3S75_000176 [Citrus x aurantiifolia]
MRISSFSLFLSLVLFFYFIFITQAKEDTNTLLVDAGDNSIKTERDKVVECGKERVECKEGKNGAQESAFMHEDYIYTQLSPLDTNLP